MTLGPLRVRPEARLHEVARILLYNRIGGLPVVEGDVLVGILTRTDMLRALQQLAQDVASADEEGEVELLPQDIILERLSP